MVECLGVNSLPLFSILTYVLHVGMCLNLAGITLNACSCSLSNPLLMTGSGIQDRFDSIIPSKLLMIWMNLWNNKGVSLINYFAHSIFGMIDTSWYSKQLRLQSSSAYKFWNKIKIYIAFEENSVQRGSSYLVYRMW